MLASFWQTKVTTYPKKNYIISLMSRLDCSIPMLTTLSIFYVMIYFLFQFTLFYNVFCLTIFHCVLCFISRGILFYATIYELKILHKYFQRSLEADFAIEFDINREGFWKGIDRSRMHRGSNSFRGSNLSKERNMGDLQYTQRIFSVELHIIQQSRLLATCSIPQTCLYRNITLTVKFWMIMFLDPNQFSSLSERKSQRETEYVTSLVKGWK